jgi:hypothetical protein
VAYACNPSYSGGKGQEDCSSKPAQANSSKDPILKTSNTKKGWWSGSSGRAYLASVVSWVQTPVLPKQNQKQTEAWKVFFSLCVYVYTYILRSWQNGETNNSILNIAIIKSGWIIIIWWWNWILNFIISKKLHLVFFQNSVDSIYWPSTIC